MEQPSEIAAPRGRLMALATGHGQPQRSQDPADRLDVERERPERPQEAAVPRLVHLGTEARRRDINETKLTAPLWLGWCCTHQTLL